jgi:hypothetical protein
MGEAHHCFCFAAPKARLRPFGKALETNHHRLRYPDFLSMLVTLSNCMRLSLKSSTGVADPRGMKRGISCPRQKVQKIPGCPIPPDFLYGLVGSTNFMRLSLRESRTRCHGWGRAVGNPGSFALFAKGGIPRISIPTVAYPTLCKERKGWGTRRFVVLPAVTNTNRGLIEHLFLLRKPHTRPCLVLRNRKSGVRRGEPGAPSASLRSGFG